MQFDLDAELISLIDAVNFYIFSHYHFPYRVTNKTFTFFLKSIKICAYFHVFRIKYLLLNYFIERACENETMLQDDEKNNFSDGNLLFAAFVQIIL